MSEQPPKRLRSDFAFADVLVAVDSAAQRNLRVVDVEDRDALKADDAFDEFERRGEAGFALDVVARGEQVRGVEACTDLQTLQPVQYFTDLFQACPEPAPHPTGVFEHNPTRISRQLFSPF